MEKGITLALFGLLYSALLGCSTLTSTQDNISGSGVPVSNLGALRITPRGIGRLAVGMTAQLRATTTSDSGGTLDVTDSVSWSSSAPLVAKINAAGLVLTSGAGVTRITASAGTSADTISLSIEPPELQSDFHPLLPEQYLWSEDGTSPEQVRYFRATFRISALPARATLYLAGPGSIVAYLNGKMVLSGQDEPVALTHPFVLVGDVSPNLQAGQNVLAVACSSGDALAAKIVPDLPGAAGFPILLSDSQWKVSTTATLGWELSTYDDNQWLAATLLGSVESDAERFKGNRDSAMYRWAGYDGISPFLARNFRMAESVVLISQNGGGFQNPGALVQQPMTAEFAVSIPQGQQSAGAYPSLVLDFGREISARLAVESDASDPVKIHIRYGESLQEALLQPFYGENELTVPPHTLSYGPKSGFRYAKLIFVDGPPVVRFRKLGADEIYYPAGYRGLFDSSDQLLNDIWDTAARTTQLSMQEGVWDGIKRDRLNWSGDFYVSGRVIQSVFFDRFIVRQTLDYLASHTLGPTGQVNNIPGYSAFWVMALADYYRYSGDTAFLFQQREHVSGILRAMASNVNDSGLFTFATSDFPFVDWSPDLFTDTSDTRKTTQFLFHRAFLEGAWLFEQIGDTEQADRARISADKVKSAAEIYWLESNSTYGSRWQDNAMAVFSGIATAAQTEAIWQNVVSQPSENIVTPYYNYFVTEAMAQSGHRKEALDWIRAYWGGMLAEGATSFWEAYDLNWPKENFHAFLQADRLEGYYVSLCHGWSSGPAAWLTEHVLGIRPLAPGFAEVAVRPDLVDLRWARGIQPTPRGEISVEYRRDTNGMEGMLLLPVGVRVFLSLPVGPGHPVLINGVPIKGVLAESGSRMVVELDRAGPYEFRTDNPQ